ncbi:MAG: lactonase family protein [Planctomycetes bacterium]|nr:lactonase family protein [Planctomycetota bacterium]
MRPKTPCTLLASSLTLLLAVLPAALLPAIALADSKEAGPKSLRAYVGTYTGGKSKGIYLVRLELATGKLTLEGLAVETTHPSFLAVHPSGRFVYAVGETADFKAKGQGSVSAFAVDEASGRLAPLNQQGSGGAGPCHIALDAAGKHALVANYGGGSVASLPIGADGKLGAAASVIQHKGSSVNPRRQEGPHAHSINLDRANRFAFAADLGLDKVLVYRFDAAKGTLEPHDPPAAALKPGAGPRHFAFHPAGRHAYVINELLCTVTAFSYEAGRGVLTEIQTLSTLPEPVKESYSTAEVQVHPSGRFVYGSNRGHDSIAVFSVEEGTGKLALLENEPTQGKTPRNFALDPTGTYLLAENQDSGTIVVFRIDPKTGRLEPTGHAAEVPSPVCVRFAPRKP